jgi:hypothetical protein
MLEERHSSKGDIAIYTRPHIDISKCIDN